MRKGTIKRVSKETEIQISLTIEGRGQYEVSTGIRFFDHMLELLAHHGGFNLRLKAKGDLDVDQHHTVEDVGIVLGQAFEKALGSKRGILRAGYFLIPMDETMGMDLRAGPKPMSMRVSFTDAPIITKSKHSSRLSPERCAPPAGAIKE